MGNATVVNRVMQLFQLVMGVLFVVVVGDTLGVVLGWILILVNAVLIALSFRRPRDPRAG